jgi:hypothetical protein
MRITPMKFLERTTVGICTSRDRKHYFDDAVTLDPNKLCARYAPDASSPGQNAAIQARIVIPNPSQAEIIA